MDSKNQFKKIYFRVDGNDVIATGHVMRCLSIAEQIKKIGIEVVFVVADESPRLLIENRGFCVNVLGTTWNDLDAETEIFCEYLKERNAEIVVIDSYYVTNKYLSNISACVKVIYIDDLYNFAYPVYGLINYSVFADKDRYKNLYKTDNENEIYAIPHFLVGADYIPLREEFSMIDNKMSSNLKKVLVTTGGTDRLNVSGKLLERFLEEEELKNLEYHIIVGCFNENKEALYNIARNSDGHVILHENVNNMSFWMTECDVAVSAGGSTLYELCACGTPTVCLEIASNQEGARRWEDKGYMMYAGNAAKDMKSCLTNCVEKIIYLLENREKREALSLRVRNLIDGKGAERIAKYLCGLIK